VELFPACTFEFFAVRGPAKLIIDNAKCGIIRASLPAGGNNYVVHELGGIKVRAHRAVRFSAISSCVYTLVMADVT